MKTENKAGRSADNTTAQDQNCLPQIYLERDEKIKRRLRSVPKRYKDFYLRITRKELPPRQAIKAQCLECVCWIVEEVRLCTDLACPLFLYRAFVSGNTPENSVLSSAESTNGHEPALGDTDEQ